MGKKVYTLPHRINESLGTQELVRKGLIEPIYDIDEFISKYSDNIKRQEDELLIFAQSNPNYDDVVNKFKEKVFEYELEGKIKIQDGKVIVT